MNDDGIVPDEIAGDGLYSAAVDYEQIGLYEVLVQARGISNLTMQTAQGLEPAAWIDGTMVDFDLPSPVDNFERAVRFQVETTGVVSDDHGNTHENATVLPAQNSISIPGKIEVGGDVDVFKITNPEGLAEIAIRVSNLAFDMDPVLKIQNELKQDIAEGTFDSSESQAGLLSVIIYTSGNESYYAEVSHRDKDGTGYYEISTGSVDAQLDLAAPTESPAQAPTESPTQTPTQTPTKVS